MTIRIRNSSFLPRKCWNGSYSCLIFPMIVARALRSRIFVLSWSCARTYFSSGVQSSHFPSFFYNLNFNSRRCLYIIYKRRSCDAVSKENPVESCVKSLISFEHHYDSTRDRACQSNTNNLIKS